MGTLVSQITSLMIVYSTFYSGADQRKHQSSASLAFVWGIHRWPVNSSHKWLVTWKMFPFDDIIMGYLLWLLRRIANICHSQDFIWILGYIRPCDNWTWLCDISCGTHTIDLALLPWQCWNKCVFDLFPLSGGCYLILWYVKLNFVPKHNTQWQLYVFLTKF